MDPPAALEQRQGRDLRDADPADAAGGRGTGRPRGPACGYRAPQSLSPRVLPERCLLPGVGGDREAPGMADGVAAPAPQLRRFLARDRLADAARPGPLAGRLYHRLVSA